VYTAGLASLLGYGIFNTLLGRNPSSAVVPWVLLAPVVAMASAWALLGQQPTTPELAGGAVLIVGVLVSMRPPRRPAPPPLAEVAGVSTVETVSGPFALTAPGGR
jgi:O-acetylserine/cysteine efflux transporter